jgi:hypothetical protein
VAGAATVEVAEAATVEAAGAIDPVVSRPRVSFRAHGVRRRKTYRMQNRRHRHRRLIIATYGYDGRAA